MHISRIGGRNGGTILVENVLEIISHIRTDALAELTVELLLLLKLLLLVVLLLRERIAGTSCCRA